METAVKLTLNLPPAPDGRSHMRRSIRRLSDFSKTVAFALRQFNARYDLRLELEPRSLTRAFLEWARNFDAQRELSERDRRDFSHFAAGLMLRSLIRNRPVTRGAEPVVRAGPRRDEDVLVDFWPEGVFYFEFCITVLDRVLEEQSLEAIALTPEAVSLRSWQSFRENVVENPDLAIPFLDLFLGGDPVWDFPTGARFRSALKKALPTEGICLPPGTPPARTS